MKITFFCLLIITTIFSSCIFEERKKEVFITDKDFVENSKSFSPDSTMVLLNYSLDLGALGYGQRGTAILKTTEINGELSQFTLPNIYSNVKWLTNNVVEAKFDIIPSIRSGQKVVLKDKLINHIIVKIKPLDYISDSADLEIVYRDTSPNKKFELVAYRYNNDEQNYGFVNVSIIPYMSKIPKFGNYLIGDKQSDYVFNGRWNSDNTLKFYTNKIDSDMIQYCLVDNRPDIDHTIVVDDKKYGNNNRWIHSVIH